MNDKSLLELKRTTGIGSGQILGAIIVVVVAIAGITWAKWWPYSHKLGDLIGTRAWSGGSILDAAGLAGAAPSLHGALEFTVRYAKSIWVALVSGLTIAAAIEAFLPRKWLLSAMSRSTSFNSSLMGGLLALPCMMCTCCGAPIAVTLRRSGVPVAGTLAYWVGNPVLNPAVIAFLILVGPWQWVVVRIVVGVVLVFGVTAVVSRLAKDDREFRASEMPRDLMGAAFTLSDAPKRFIRALARMCLTLLPEYLLIVFVLGLFRGWLFPFGSATNHWGILAVLLSVVVGTILVIPTAGEIPILLGLSSIGAGPAVIGALLVTLPAVSLPSMAMVSRSVSARATALMAVGVGGAGVMSGVLLWLLFR